MKTAILHLSDMHISEVENEHKQLIEKLTQLVKGHTHEIDNCFCVITGDT